MGPGRSAVLPPCPSELSPHRVLFRPLSGWGTFLSGLVLPPLPPDSILSSSSRLLHSARAPMLPYMPVADEVRLVRPLPPVLFLHSNFKPPSAMRIPETVKHPISSGAVLPLGKHTSQCTSAKNIRSGSTSPPRVLRLPPPLPPSSQSSHPRTSSQSSLPRTSSPI
jgi:hypothetical protein